MKRPTRPCRIGHPRGWTLVEAMVATAVASTLASVAVPNMSRMQQAVTVQTSATELLGALQLARSEAIRLGQRVVVSPQQGADWRSGWVVYVDANDDGARGPGETVLQSYAPRARAISVTAHFGANNDGSVLSFTPEGVMRRPGSRGLMLGRLTVQQDGNARSLCVASVRIRTVTTDRCA